MSDIVVCNKCGRTWRSKAKRPQCYDCKAVDVRPATKEEAHSFNHPETTQETTPDNKQENPQNDKQRPILQPAPDQRGTSDSSDNGIIFNSVRASDICPVSKEQIIQTDPQGPAGAIPSIFPEDPTPEDQDPTPKGLNFNVVLISGAVLTAAIMAFITLRKPKRPAIPEAAPAPAPQDHTTAYAKPAAFC